MCCTYRKKLEGEKECRQADTAVLYLHGGAFVTGSPATHRELVARLSAAINAGLLVLDYRLAPEHPFPAAMEDAVSAYQWLLDKGFSEKRLVIGGDSAGGGLALQTLITLRYEILLSDAVRLAERARAAQVDVEIKIWSGMWHVFQLNARFIPEARQSIKEIGQFIVMPRTEKTVLRHVQD